MSSLTSVQTTIKLCKTISVAVALALLAWAPVQAANVWDGGGDDNYWNTAMNWDNDTAPTFPAALTFAGSMRLAASNDVIGAAVAGILFATDAGAFTLDGEPITLSTNITIAGGGTAVSNQAVNLPVTLASGVSLRAAPVGGSYSDTPGTLIVNGVISGPHGITIDKKNYVQLNGANTYTGGTLIRGSDTSISIGHSQAFGMGKVTFGATVGESQFWIQASGDQTIANDIEVRTGRFIAATGNKVAGKAPGNLTFTGNVLLSQNSWNDFYSHKTITFTGPISGSSGLRLASGTIILRGANTFTGGLGSSDGSSTVFDFNADAALGHTNNSFAAPFSTTLRTAASTSFSLAPTRSISVTALKTVSFDIPSGSALTVPGSITGAGTVKKTGAGTLSLAGNNTYSGGTTLSSGKLVLFSDASLGASDTPVAVTGLSSIQAGDAEVTLSAGRALSLTNVTATFDVSSDSTMALAGPFAFAWATNSVITKTGAGKLALSGGSDGTVLGDLNVSEGSFSIQGGDWLMAPSAQNDGANFNVDGGATYEQTGGTNRIPYYSCISQHSKTPTELISTGLFSGGRLIGYELMIGRRNSGVLTVSGDAFLDLSLLKLGEEPGYATVCNLDGGTVKCWHISSRGTNSQQTTSILNLNGGKILAKSSEQNLFGGWGGGAAYALSQVNVKSGGSVIDTDSYKIYIKQIMSHASALGETPDGGLTKLGTGTLEFNTNATFTGATRIEAGTLTFTVNNVLPSGNSVTVSEGATFNVNGKALSLAGIGGGGTITNAQALSVNGTITPGDSGSYGTLTMSPAPAALSGTLSVDVAADGSCDRLHVIGNLDLSALSLTVKNPEQLDRWHQYPVATCTGTLVTPFALTGTLPPRWVVKYHPQTQTAVLTYDFGTLIRLQ